MAPKRPEAQGKASATLGSRKVNIVDFPFLFNPPPSRTNFKRFLIPDDRTLDTGGSELISSQHPSSHRCRLPAPTRLCCPGLAPPNGADFTLAAGPMLGSENPKDSGPCSPEAHSPVGVRCKTCYQDWKGWVLQGWLVVATGSILESFLEAVVAD